MTATSNLFTYSQPNFEGQTRRQTDRHTLSLSLIPLILTCIKQIDMLETEAMYVQIHNYHVVHAYMYGCMHVCTDVYLCVCIMYVCVCVNMLGDTDSDPDPDPDPHIDIPFLSHEQTFAYTNTEIIATLHTTDTDTDASCLSRKHLFTDTDIEFIETLHNGAQVDYRLPRVFLHLMKHIIQKQLEQIPASNSICQCVYTYTSTYNIDV